jgi:hypothetical protein
MMSTARSESSCSVTTADIGRSLSFSVEGPEVPCVGAGEGTRDFDNAFSTEVMS